MKKETGLTLAKWFTQDGAGRKDRIKFLKYKVMDLLSGNGKKDSGTPEGFKKAMMINPGTPPGCAEY